MGNQFIFFCVNIGNEKLLKEEIKNFYPELTLSYSRKGFLTFKNLGVQYSLSTISQLESTFSTRVGICLGKTNPEGILEATQKYSKDAGLDFEKAIIHSFSINTEFLLDADSIFKKEVNIYSASDKVVFNIISLAEDEIWYGVHFVAKGITRFPNSCTDISVPEDVPSKSYLKLAQVVELYAIKFDSYDYWLDFGSCPGGSSLFLLSRGCKVWGIDPAVMTSSVLSNKNYTHINIPVQDLSQEKLPDLKVSWIHVDLNLKPPQAIKEVLRLIKKYNFSIKGIIFTIQLPNMDYIKELENFEDQFYDWGFSNIRSVQVPTHKNEYVVIATKH